jgi:hypothetical protein
LWIAGIAQKADNFRRGYYGEQHFQFFRTQRDHEEGNAGHLTAGPVQRRHQPLLDRITAGRENCWDSRAGRLHGLDAAARNQHRDFVSDEVRQEWWHAVELSVWRRRHQA